MSELKFKGTQGDCNLNYQFFKRNSFSEVKWINIQQGKTIVAEVKGLHYGIPDEECIANAKLFVAASDLLNACQRILETDYGCAPSAGYMDELKKVCETAVKKALE